MSSPARAVVIGAGSTGCALAHDLTLRGLHVVVLERAGIASGATGHNQAQLHSGARYAVTDPEAARECIQENWILRRIQPETLELNDGLFVAIDEEGMEYRKVFLEACEVCGIPGRELAVEEALRIEPLLNPGILAAIQIPDGVFDPYRLCLSFLATACWNGAEVRTFCEVTALDVANRKVTFHSKLTGRDETVQGDVVINAAGPWTGIVGSLGSLHVPVEPSAGAMATTDRRVCNMVINLLAPPGDGDIIVPQRQTSILGTTSWSVEDPDNIPIIAEQVEAIMQVAEKMIPAVRQAPVRGVMAAARPLLQVDGAGGRVATRGFACIDHSVQGAPGFFSVVGGKTTTARLMAEKTADQVCAFLGVEAACQTRGVHLLSYRKWAAS
jgi:glycerol-3-phosphate dehydrogenase